MTPKLHAFLPTCAVLLCVALLGGCDQLFERQKPVDKSASEHTDDTPAVNHENLLSAANLFAYTQLSEALSHAQTLDRVIASFLHHPNPLSLKECQDAWIKTYNAYLQVSFFYQVPRFEKPQFIEQSQTYENLHQRLDQWPIEGGYIDYLPGYPLSGIINDMTLKVSEKSLLEQHGFSDFSYASVGFHPLEFLLFGQDGKRSARDFIPKENSIEVVSIDADEHKPNGTDTTDGITEEQAQRALAQQEASSENAADLIKPQNHNRRREYVRILSALLVENLQALADRWDPAHGYYAKAWRHPDTAPSVERLFQAVINHLQNEVIGRHLGPLMVSETTPELRSPYANADTKNLHALLLGVQTWWLTDHGMAAELQLHNPELALNLEKQFEAVLTRVGKLDQALVSAPLEKRQQSLELVQADLLKLMEMLYASAEALGIFLEPLPVSSE